jgi:hypothetical protein
MTYRQDRKMAFKFKVKEEADRLKPVGQCIQGEGGRQKNISVFTSKRTRKN